MILERTWNRPVLLWRSVALAAGSDRLSRTGEMYMSKAGRLLPLNLGALICLLSPARGGAHRRSAIQKEVDRLWWSPTRHVVQPSTEPTWGGAQQSRMLVTDGHSSYPAHVEEGTCGWDAPGCLRRLERHARHGPCEPPGCGTGTEHRRRQPCCKLANFLGQQFVLLRRYGHCRRHGPGHVTVGPVGG